MPWEIRQDGDEYCVHRSDTGEREACHDTESEAEDHMAALYASESDKAMSLNERIGMVEQHWHEIYKLPRMGEVNMADSGNYVAEIFDDHLIAYFWDDSRPASQDSHFRVSYSISEDGDVEFAPRNEWVEVESKQEWVEAAKAYRRELMAEQRRAKARSESSDNALKALSKTDTEIRVGNYMVLFGGRDLEGVASPRTNPDGSTGEYFTKSTKFDSSYTSMDLVAVDWEHGMAPADEPGPDDVLGRVDWKTAQIDDKGLFVERVLNRRNRYVQYLEELIDAGLIGNSSEAVPEGIEKAEDGQIKRWPVKRDALTVTPMEPRMMTENQLSTLKSLSERYPALKSLLAASQFDVETEPEADGKSAATVAEDANEAERLLLEIEIMELES